MTFYETKGYDYKEILDDEYDGHLESVWVRIRKQWPMVLWLQFVTEHMTKEKKWMFSSWDNWPMCPNNMF